jgi:arylsulfatase A-like enzyme
VRAGDYKLIEWYEDNSIELYNLRNDISEKHNLAKKMPEKVEKLRRMLHRWRRQMKAKMPASGPREDFKLWQDSRNKEK